MEYKNIQSPSEVNVQMVPPAYSAPTPQPGYSAAPPPQPGYAPPPQPVIMQPGIAQQSTTVVIQNQPAPQVNLPREWSTGMCGCCSDASSCLLSFFCHQCYLMHLYSRSGENCCLPCCLPLPTALLLLRTKIRAENNIKGDICTECFEGMFCSFCHLAQLGREMDIIARGLAAH